MFTGIIEEIGSLVSLPGASGGAVTVYAPGISRKLEEKDSVSVNGVCLSVSRLDQGHFSADVSPETARTTTLSVLAPRTAVNVETPLTVHKYIGGHMVTGHIDTRGRIKSVQMQGGFKRLRVDLGHKWPKEYLVAKGSIAVDGVSLTAAEVFADGFTAALIPETLRRTNLGACLPGQVVNIEFDIIGKYIVRWLQQKGPPASLTQLLAQAGFMGA